MFKCFTAKSINTKGKVTVSTHSVIKLYFKRLNAVAVNSCLHLHLKLIREENFKSHLH